jgi:hypothetical protein
MVSLSLSFIEYFFAAAIALPIVVPLMKFFADWLAGKLPVFGGYAALVNAI